MTYGDIYRQSEVEQCTYNFELADVDALRASVRPLRGRGEAGARRRAWSCPGLEMVLKCSHTFNLLDARGAVGVTQRAAYLGRMRVLSRRAATAYVEQRERLGYPLLATEPRDGGLRVRTRRGGSRGSHDAGLDPARRADLLVELGVEELPSDDLTSALGQLTERAADVLTAAGLSFDDVFRSTERLADSCSPSPASASVRPFARRRSRGRQPSVAFDHDGNPTRAAEGFARSNGVAVDQLTTEESGGRSLRRGAQAGGVAAGAGAARRSRSRRLFGGLRFGRSMYWETPEVTFSRPIRWLLALWGDELVPATVGRVQSGNVTWTSARRIEAHAVPVASAADYTTTVERLGVVLSRSGAPATDPRTRAGRSPSRRAAGWTRTTISWKRSRTWSSCRRRCSAASTRPSLDAPAEALVTVMKKHQRYFPIYGPDGKLLPRFVAVANGRRERPELVIRRQRGGACGRGSRTPCTSTARISRSRWPTSCRRSGSSTFLEGLGSLLDKTRRLEQLAGPVAAMLGFDS